MNPKCGRCPLLTEDRECPGQKNDRVCYRADTSSPGHSPGILAKIVSFTTAVVGHVAAGMPMASEEQKNARLAICKTCENFENSSCRLCGCHMPFKVMSAVSSCPHDPPKWGPITSCES